MTLGELSKILHDMYENAPRGEKTTMIHLFGIKYADAIRNSDFTIKELLKAADMYESYNVEVNKGISLAKYVTLKG